MSLRPSFVAVAVVAGTVFVVGCGQTSSSPTSPSSLLPSASSVSDGRVTANANGSLDLNGPWQTLQASVVNDPRGDSTSPSPYLDVVHANVVEQGHETLLFMMVLAGRIPEQPSEPSPLAWVFHVDTDPNASPGGLYNEYVVRVRWSGTAFIGEVIDRTGAPTLVTTVLPPGSVRFDGTTVKVFVQVSALGTPSSFGWNAATRPITTPPSPYLDFAPDGGIELATWTSREGN